MKAANDPLDETGAGVRALHPVACESGDFGERQTVVLSAAALTMSRRGSTLRFATRVRVVESSWAVRR
jgi:hypothetical protein